MLFLKGTRAVRMLWGLAVLVLAYFAAESLGLLTVHWMLSKFLASIVLIIIVVFQQDIRRALIQVGRPFTSREMMKFSEYLEEISRAVISMSTAKIGGIIAVERSVQLRDLLETGVKIDAEVSRELILSIFNKNSPLHDGAVLIKDGRLIKAGCILPLTEKELTKSMGTRHRAAIGLSEETDAVVIVVSEKTGEVSVVVEERLELDVEPLELLVSLRRVLVSDGQERRGIFSFLRPFRGSARGTERRGRGL
jgi:diadenylate cyclase